MNNEIFNMTDEEIRDGWVESGERANELYRIHKSYEDEMKRRYNNKLEEKRKELQK